MNSSSSRSQCQRRLSQAIGLALIKKMRNDVEVELTHHQERAENAHLSHIQPRSRPDASIVFTGNRVARSLGPKLD
jgi:hypothetical protein